MSRTDAFPSRAERRLALERWCRLFSAAQPDDPEYQLWRRHCLPNGWGIAMPGDGVTYGTESSGYLFEQYRHEPRL